LCKTASNLTRFLFHPVFCTTHVTMADDDNFDIDIYGDETPDLKSEAQTSL